MNERQFAAHFSGFWRASLPNLETVVRALNLAAEREQRPLVSGVEPSRRDLVSETSFQYSALNATPPGTDDLGTAEANAIRFLSGHAETRSTYKNLTPAEKAEARTLSDRLSWFVRTKGLAVPARPKFKPRFAGHGSLESCEGDIEIGSTLIEIKSVDRGYRSVDLRQLLVYASLGYLAGNKMYSELVLYNSLRGTSISIDTGQLISAAGGKTKEEFFYELSYTVSSGEISR